MRCLFCFKRVSCLKEALGTLKLKQKTIVQSAVIDWNKFQNAHEQLRKVLKNLLTAWTEEWNRKPKQRRSDTEQSRKSESPAELLWNHLHRVARVQLPLSAQTDGARTQRTCTSTCGVVRQARTPAEKPLATEPEPGANSCSFRWVLIVYVVSVRAADCTRSNRSSDRPANTYSLLQGSSM